MIEFFNLKPYQIGNLIRPIIPSDIEDIDKSFPPTLYSTLFYLLVQSQLCLKIPLTKLIILLSLLWALLMFSGHLVKISHELSLTKYFIESLFPLKCDESGLNLPHFFPNSYLWPRKHFFQNVVQASKLFHIPSSSNFKVLKIS